MSYQPSSSEQAVETLLAQYGRFGVDLGLERIEALLTTLGQPQRQVPLIHVAGTNGKGSVCAYLASVLVEAGYQVGRYTSPHLVSWCERIAVNRTSISSHQLLEILQWVEAAIPDSQAVPTQFEVFTAAAWVYFAQQTVDVAVMEVGLGGRLDATNVCNSPLISVITSLSREHWQRLGPTLADIAGEKAGILKSGRPAVIGQLPPEAEAVVRQRLKDLGCPAVWPLPARRLGQGWACYEGAVEVTGQGTSMTTPENPVAVQHNQPFTYPLPALGKHQLMNSAVAIATLHQLRHQGWHITDDAIRNGLQKAIWPGRLQWTTWQDPQGKEHTLLLDGAHNPAAAQALRAYVDEALQPGTGLTWVMGMLSTKDHADIFQALLRPGDRLHVVPVPDHLSSEPVELSALAKSVCPELEDCQHHRDLETGLIAATQAFDRTVILCGSLYLIGHFLATQRAQN